MPETTMLAEDLTDPARWQTKLNRLFAEVPFDPAAEKGRESDSPPPPTEPGERRRYRFRENRFNNTQIAERSGLGVDAIGKFRNGKRTLGVENLVPIAVAFGVDPVWWMLPCSESPLNYRLSGEDADLTRAFVQHRPGTVQHSLMLRLAEISSPEVLDQLDRLLMYVEPTGALQQIRRVLDRIDATNADLLNEIRRVLDRIDAAARY